MKRRKVHSSGDPASNVVHSTYLATGIHHLDLLAEAVKVLVATVLSSLHPVGDWQTFLAQQCDNSCVSTWMSQVSKFQQFKNA